MFKIQEFAKMHGVSSKTLRFYDKIGLLKAKINPHNGYRMYSQTDSLLLQQILCFKFLNFSLENIKLMLNPIQCSKTRLQQQKLQLQQEKTRIESAIETLEALDDSKQDLANITPIIHQHKQRHGKKIALLNLFEQQHILQEQPDVPLLQRTHIYWKNIKGRYQGCNSTMLSALGNLSLSQFINKKLSDFCQDKSSILQVKRIDERILSDHKAQFIDENGYGVRYLSRKGPMFDENGKTVGLFGVSIPLD